MIGRTSRYAKIFAVVLFCTFSARADLIDSTSIRIFETEIKREVVEGVAEKHRSKIWYASSEKTEISVLLVHGLFSSPYFMNGLKEQFEARGINGVSFLLSGHWRNPPEALNYVTPDDWIADFENAYKVASGLGKKVLVIGHSTGALLGVRKSLENPQNLYGLALAAPALALQPKISFFASILDFDLFSSSRLCKVEDPGLICRIIYSIASNSCYGLTRKLAFQASAFSHSATSPYEVASFNWTE